MPRIIILGGGTSAERDVSLRSAQQIFEAAQGLKMNVIMIDPRDDQSYLSAGHDDIVLPILHGSFGEDGTVQAQLEERHIPFLGAVSEVSVKCFDKWKTRQTLHGRGLPVTQGALVSFDQYQAHPLADAPHVLKLLDGGSSIGTYMIRDQATRQSVTAEMFNGTNLLIEECIFGTEITVPILDDKALPVIEIIPPDGLEFDYDNKYNGKTRELCPPVSLSAEQQSAAQELALRTYQVMQSRHLSRIDIMIDEAGAMYVLEINTIPGLTKTSLMPLSAAVAGYDINLLTQRFIELVVRDYQLDISRYKI